MMEKRDHEERQGHVDGLSVGTVPQPQGSFELHLRHHARRLRMTTMGFFVFPQSSGRAQ